MTQCTSAPLGNIKQNLPIVLGALKDFDLTSPPMVLAAVATIRVEANRFEPVSEFTSRLNTSPGGEPFDLYDYRRDLGNRGVPDGSQYMGRGFVRLIGRANYARFGTEIGIDISGNPELANEPSVAAKLLAAVLKVEETHIKGALALGDFASARRAINGSVNGLGEFIQSYETGARRLNISSAASGGVTIGSGSQLEECNVPGCGQWRTKAAGS